ncbi:MAG TPA: sigma-54 dependent transcriptional regulator [Pseudomonadota bacterium]|jgi:DNA-binding NtrC family response regulator|nr:sigma-54 dependent transcriptional regulator [Pseudomonadota bacterium]HNK43790.1 sigma-54 dependent transcriptional regulator [Pseudomonadota bacterium]HNN52133.1 sigma-54 dependent transcriptional regulator [Pseudomonadota bacterium]HNO68122.1 sigma-54 dependent transcriptional regulator [Pseudomonadota bacterium]
MRHILLVDDEPKLGKMLATALQSAGYTVDRAMTGGEALKKLASEPFDVVITDLKLPDMSGMQVVQRVRELSGAPDVMMMTAYATAETAVEAMRLGAVDYLIKPFSIDELRIKISRLIGRRMLQEQNGNLQAQLEKAQSIESLVGTSARMREVMEQVQQVGPTDATVLLLGESGTGKTALARAIHQQSRRRNGPLCEVHCAALPSTLLESELFGHERGAFTGAVEQRLGHIEKADRGTLFLDEIGEIPPAVQVKLLRFIQDRTFHRVGSSQARSVDLRIICASNRNLAQAVKDGSLREDFYYRINVFPIHLPALRERSDDIPKLVQDILRRRHPSVTVSQPALDLLQRYPWPGNVRELENVIERAAILVGTDRPHGENVITAEHLPRSFVGSVLPVTTSGLLQPGFSIDRLERDLIWEALARTSGNKTEAAKLLGITRRRLYSRLKSIENDAEAEENPSDADPNKTAPGSS